MDVVRFAVVGVGGFGKSHIKAINQNSNARLVAVCDEELDIAKKRGEENGARYYTDYYQMLSGGGFDCVCVATPDKLHRAHTVAALEKGYHVLCEKPLALTEEDCAAIVEAEMRSGRICMVGQICRKTPAFIMAKELIDSGEIGKLRFVESEYAHDYEFLSPKWRNDPENPRHGIIGGGCHSIDLLRWFAGDPSEVIALSNRKVLPSWPVDDTTIAIMRFPRNVIGKVFCSIGAKRSYTMRTCIYGSRGTIICDNQSNKLRLYREKTVPDKGEGYTMLEIDVLPAGHNMIAEINDMVSAIRAGDRVECDSIEGYNTVAVGLAAVRSSEMNGEKVKPKYFKRDKNNKK